MTSELSVRAGIFIPRAATAALVIAIVFALTAVLIQSVQAQTFKVIYNFTGGKDQANPAAGLIMDKGGALYGTASSDPGPGYGSVCRLQKTGSGWFLVPLYDFAAGNDGGVPLGGVVFGPDGSLYGTTEFGGGSNCIISGNGRVPGCGTVFSVKPGPTALGPWKETVLYRFTGGSDGAIPYAGDLAFDEAGNIYGTTWIGGSEGNCLYGYHCGTVYKLTRSGGTWGPKRDLELRPTRRRGNAS